MTNFKKLSIKADKLADFTENLMREIKDAQNSANSYYENREPETWENSWEKMNYEAYITRVDALTELISDLERVKL